MKSIDEMSNADVKQQYGALMVVADGEMYGSGTEVFNNNGFCALRPLAGQIFSAPASSITSERVFSKAGLAMRPHTFTTL